jgi:hypothetical protein
MLIILRLQDKVKEVVYEDICLGRKWTAFYGYLPRLSS